MCRIEICGGVASGKTTLAQRISEVIGIAIFEENFTDVPFWRECYDSGGRQFVFHKNLSFLPYHAHRLIEANAAAQSVCDFAFFQDLAYADISAKSDVKILEQVFGRFATLAPAPAVIIDLSCSTNTLLERIRFRARAPEKVIDAAFLDRLRGAIGKRRRQFEQQNQLKFIDVDSEAVDFRSDLTPVRKIWAEVERIINSR